MKRALVTILLVTLLVAGTVGCTSGRSERQLAKIEAQIQTLTAALTSTQQELASAKQALAEAQNKANLLQQQQPVTATSSIGVTTPFATRAAYTAAPTIVSFTATPTVIMIGQSSTLQWNVTGADSVSLDPGIGIVSYAGVQAVYPTASTTYILIASNSYGSTTAYATITIPEVYSPPSYPYYSGYPYYTPRYTSPPAPPRPPLPTPPAPRPGPRPMPPFPPAHPLPHPPFSNNSTIPHFPFPR